MSTITIDGKPIIAPEGANLLQVARDNGIDIPGLVKKPANGSAESVDDDSSINVSASSRFHFRVNA